jgi:hypothetical protein
MASVSSGITVAPHVEPGVVQDRLGDRDDRGQLLDVQELVGPRDLGGLLEAGVAVDEVGRGQRREDRHAGLVGRHPHLPEQRQGRRLVGEAAEDVVGDDLGDQRLELVRLRCCCTPRLTSGGG